MSHVTPVLCNPMKIWNDNYSFCLVELRTDNDVKAFRLISRLKKR